MIAHLKSFLTNKTGRAIGIVFACSGLVFGSWASFIPFIKEKFDLDEAQLGLLLLSMPVGIIIVNPVSVVLIRYWGPVKTALLFAVLTGFAFLIPVISTSIPLVSIGLMLSGGSFGITNVSMNTCGAVFEEQSGLRLISSCHGMWSVGAMSGALLSGLSLIPFQNCCNEYMVPQVMYVLVQALFVCIVIGSMYKNLHPVESARLPKSEMPKMSLRMIKPGKELWIIISICLCTYLTEGTIADWSSVYLREVTHASATIAGRGFAVYAFFMAAGRFIGDDLIARFGNMRVLRGGGVLVVLGLILIIISPTHLFAMPGFMLTGAGISLASPILYQASAKVNGLPPGVGLATMNTFAMTAFLGGPVLIGFIAKFSNLRTAFIVVAFTAVLWIIQTTRVIQSASGSSVIKY